MVQASSSTPPHRCSQIRSSAGKGRSRNHQQPANLRRTRRRPIAVFPILCSHPSGLVTFRGPKATVHLDGIRVRCRAALVTPRALPFPRERLQLKGVPGVRVGVVECRVDPLPTALPGRDPASRLLALVHAYEHTKTPLRHASHRGGVRVLIANVRLSSLFAASRRYTPPGVSGIPVAPPIDSTLLQRPPLHRIRPIRSPCAGRKVPRGRPPRHRIKMTSSAASPRAPETQAGPAAAVVELEPNALPCRVRGPPCVWNRPWS